VSSILAVCINPDSIDLAEKIAAECGYRIRTVSTVAAGREWIALETFEVAMIEEGFDPQETIKFFEAVWKAGKLCEGVLFNFNAPLENPWEAILIGAQAFSGADGLADFKDLLAHLKHTVPSSDLDRLGVLIVDDLDAPRDILCAYIQKLGFPLAKGVSSVEQALGELKANGGRYFCVLSDISMPEKSGINLLNEIRGIDGLKLLPVIICTAYPTAEHLVRCIVEGATGFMVKPPKKPLLLSELDKAKRFYRTGKDPRLCPAHLAGKFEEAMQRRGLI
jgi:CheY-like chemotaxis protein